jgi:hypothetical protein
MRSNHKTGFTPVAANNKMIPAKFDNNFSACGSSMIPNYHRFVRQAVIKEILDMLKADEIA